MTAADDLNMATWEEAIITYLKVLSWAFELKSRCNQEDSSVKIADKDTTLTWQCLLPHFLTCSVKHIKKLMTLQFNIPLLLYHYYFLFYSCSCIKNKINNIQHWNYLFANVALFMVSKLNSTTSSCSL
jgi:hypothetical protein